SDDDKDRGDDDGLCRCATDALCAAANGQTFVAADGGEDEAEDDGLHEALHEVAEFEDVNGASPEFDGAETERKNGSGATTEKTDKVSEAGEKRLHENGG